MDNAERWSALIDALNRGDIETFVGYAHPQLAYWTLPEEPDSLVGGDIEAFKGMVATWVATFDDFRCETESATEIDRDRTIALTTLKGRGSTSGIEVNDPYVFLVTWRDGQFVEVHEYRTEAEALQAARAPSYPKSSR